MTYRSLRRYMSRRQITVRGFYSLISADALQILIFQICSENPRLGIKMVANRLLAMRHRVQRVRVREAMNLIFCSRQVNRRLRRREYSVRAPLSVFHFDGDHITLTCKKSWSFTRSPYINGQIFNSNYLGNETR